MAVVHKALYLLRQKRGDEAVSFLMTTAMLVLIFATLVSAMIYITQYYNVSYMCRRVVRSIEISGQYDETETANMVNQMKNSDLEDIHVQVDAVYYDAGSKKIQLRQTFSVTLTTNYRITIMTMGETPIAVDLPIRVKVAGMSEVYWRS